MSDEPIICRECEHPVGEQGPDDTCPCGCHAKLEPVGFCESCLRRGRDYRVREMVEVCRMEQTDDVAYLTYHVPRDMVQALGVNPSAEALKNLVEGEGFEPHTIDRDSYDGVTVQETWAVKFDEAHRRWKSEYEARKLRQHHADKCVELVGLIGDFLTNEPNWDSGTLDHIANLFYERRLADADENMNFKYIG